MWLWLRMWGCWVLCLLGVGLGELIWVGVGIIFIMLNVRLWGNRLLVAVSRRRLGRRLRMRGSFIFFCGLMVFLVWVRMLLFGGLIGIRGCGLGIS